MAKWNGVDPKRSHANEFEREARREYLTPFLQWVLSNAAGFGIGLPASVILDLIEASVEVWMQTQDIKGLVDVATRWASRVDVYHEHKFVREFIRVAQVDVRPALARSPVNQILGASIEESVGLIETLPRRSAEAAKAIITRQYVEGELSAPLDLKARETMLRQWYKGASRSTRYNLRRITRDQSNKLTGHLSRARQEAVGVRSYIWRTSEDDRVRPTHADKNGLTFQWGDPPSDTGAPGEDIQCRCVAIPNISIEEIRSRSGRPE